MDAGAESGVEDARAGASRATSIVAKERKKKKQTNKGEVVLWFDAAVDFDSDSDSDAR